MTHGAPRSARVRSLLSAACTLLLGGCAYEITPVSMAPAATRHVAFKNYEIGKPQTAFVGEPILRRKDYEVLSRRAAVARPTEDFKLSNGQIAVRGRRGVGYAITGEYEHNGSTYTIVEVERQVLAGPAHMVGILIDGTGSLYSKAFVQGILQQGFAVTPPTCRFVRDEVEHVDTKAAFVNYELLYGGTDGRSFTATYREYTPEDFARPAYSQNLVYEAKPGTIRFRNTRLEVLRITGESIDYRVIDDTLSDPVDALSRGVHGGEGENARPGHASVPVPASARLKPGFRGLSWGDPPLPAMRLTRENESGKVFTHPDDDLKLGQVPLQSIEYLFVGGRLALVWIEFEPGFYDELRLHLAGVWGAPEEHDPEKKTSVWRASQVGPNGTMALLALDQAKSAGGLLLQDGLTVGVVHKPRSGL